MPADWSIPLPRSIVIPELTTTLRTLADVRELMQHLPASYRERQIWKHLASELEKAASGADPLDAFVTLRLVLMIERVPYHVQDHEVGKLGP